MMIEQKTTPLFKIVYDHGTHCEIQDLEGKLKRYTRQQVESLKALMPDFHWQTIVFRDYSSKAGIDLSVK